MKKAVVLALDMGTSSVRAMLFDARGRALPGAEVQRPYAQRTTSDGGVETDAEVLLEQTVDCIRRLLRQTDGATRAQLAAVGVSCFWHSLVGVDGGGRAATPVYSWADTRARAQAEALAARLDPKDYHARTGCELHPSFWPAKLCWLAETQAEPMSRVARWMSFGEYLFLRLFGHPACSLSMASGTGLLDPNRAAWDDQTLAVLPLRTDQLNPLTDRGNAQQGLTKEWARTLAPVKDAPWFPAVGDGACSNIGSGGISDRRVAINVGTSGAMRIVVQAGQVTVQPGLFCYRVDRERFLVGGALAGGGNIYAWQHDSLQLGSPAIASRRLGTMLPDSHGLTVLPFWAGERSTGWHAEARAVLAGMNLHTTPLDILRASLESVAYRFAAVRDLLAQRYPQAQEIVASGGAILHDRTWIQIMADVFGMPVTASRVMEASSRGAALLALQSLGVIREFSDAPLYQGRRYAPNPDYHAVYQQARARHEALYRTLIGQ